MLLLDNFEHVADAAVEVAQLLTASAGMKVLTTSREPLYLRLEQQIPLAPLPAPQVDLPMTKHASWFDYAAIQFFVSRARLVQPGFVPNDAELATIGSICARLDGLPLAIELAAARLKHFTPQRLLQQIETTSPLQTLHSRAQDRPARHQTLAATIAWSYDLLPSVEQALFRRLAVFVGGCTAEAAKALYGDINDPDAEDIGNIQTDMVLEILISLLDKNLLIQQPHTYGEPRFAMLETIREFGLAQLQATAELAQTQEQHAVYYTQLAFAANPHKENASEPLWVEQLELDHYNLHAAIDWTITQRRLEEAMRLGEALLEFWIRSNHWWEGAERLKRILALTTELPPSSMLARFLFCVGLAIEPREGARHVKPLYARSLALSRALEDKKNIAFALNKLGDIAFVTGDYATWENNLHESEPLKLAIGEHFHYALIMGMTGYNLCQLERFEEGLAHCEKSVVLHRQINDRWGLIVALRNYGQALLLFGDLTKAEQIAQEGLALAQELGSDYQITDGQHIIGCIRLEQGEFAEATKLLRGALEIRAKLMFRYRILDSLIALATLASAQKRFSYALTLATVVERQRSIDGIVLAPVDLQRFGRLVTTARQTLTVDAIAAAISTGERMTLTAAVDYGLGEELLSSAVNRKA